MSILSAISQEKYGDINKEKLDTELDENIGNANYSSELTDDGISVTFKNSGRTYIVDDTGNITSFTPIPITELSFVNTAFTIDEEESQKITINKVPSNATEKLIWESSDETVATVDSNGNVTAVAVKSGQTTSTATITVKNSAGTVLATNNCIITVKKGYKNLVKNYRTTEEWELLYNGKVDSDGEERVYLIMKGALNSASLQITGYNGTTDFATKLTGNETESEKNTKEAALTAFNAKYPAIAQGLLYKTYSNGIIHQTNVKSNMKATQYLLDSSLSKWSTYKDIVTDTHPNQFADYVIGGPTLELLVASYNSRQTSDDNKVTIPNPSEYGYKRTGESSLPAINLPENTDGSNPWNHGNSIVYWLASPSENYQGNTMNHLQPTGNVRCDSRYDATHSFRPVVCLKSNYTVQKNGAGWIIVEKE